MLACAKRLNLDTRIGFEDTLEDRDRLRRATSNEQLGRHALAVRPAHSRRGAEHRR
jgi:hypothetical protein